MALSARQLYQSQKGSANKRSIAFNLTFDQWYNWFLSHGIDKNIPEKMSKNKMCMCRYNDTGPYELGNIYLDTNSNNVSLRNRIYHRSNPKLRLKTPVGIFNTKTDAATALNVHFNTISRWIKTRPNEFYYV